MGRAQGESAVHARGPAAARDAAGQGRHATASGQKREPELHGIGSHDSLPRPQHLGAYAPLVAAMREELEQFVASHVRMHLAIAEHDRYLLTSIDVECVAGDEPRELLQRFMREFKPRQIKAYIAKEVIGRLPNASAIDLAHFGGLNVAPGGGTGAGADEAYGELLAELRSTEPRAGQQPYQVSLKGRWSELDTAARGREGQDRAVSTFRARRSPDDRSKWKSTMPMAAAVSRCTSVVPGRRYAVGNGEGSDIVVNGKYASRRHCEIWLDKGAWWVTDSGSTNGIRVESAGRVLGRSGANAGRFGRTDGDRSGAGRTHRPVRARARRARRNTRGFCCEPRATSARRRRRWRRACPRPRHPRRRSLRSARVRAEWS